MNKVELIDLAAKLTPPPLEAVEEYASRGNTMAEEMNRIMADRTDITRLVGEGNIQMMCDNHRNHVRFMESLFLCYSPRLFVETVLWVYRAYRSHGFQLTYWPAQLDTWLALFEQHLRPETCQALRPFYLFILNNQASFTALTEKTPTPTSFS